MGCTLALLATLAAAAPSTAPDAPPQDAAPLPRFSTSPGPFERAWALVDPEVPPRPPAADLLPPSGSDEREAAEVWRTWARAVRTAANSDEAASERLWLAAFARGQGRFDDAWDHLAHSADDAAGMRATLPLLVPGVQPAELAQWPRLPDGALLAPALPPPDRPASEVLLGTGRVRRGTARAESFRVGAALVALTVTVEGDGVQVDLQHLEGGPARVRVLLPEPPDFELRSEYLDWSRLEGSGIAREVALEAGDETVTLFGRYRPRRVEWPVQVPPGLPAQAERDGLRLLVTPEGGSSDGLCAGLRELLGLAVEQRSVPVDAIPPAFSGVQVDLRDPGVSGAKRAGLVSVAERFALSRPR